MSIERVDSTDSTDSAEFLNSPLDKVETNQKVKRNYEWTQARIAHIEKLKVLNSVNKGNKKPVISKKEKAIIELLDKREQERRAKEVKPDLELIEDMTLIKLKQKGKVVVLPEPEEDYEKPKRGRPLKAIPQQIVRQVQQYQIPLPPPPTPIPPPKKTWTFI